MQSQLGSVIFEELDSVSVFASSVLSIEAMRSEGCHLKASLLDYLLILVTGNVAI